MKNCPNCKGTIIIMKNLTKIANRYYCKCGCDVTVFKIDQLKKRLKKHMVRVAEDKRRGSKAAIC